jgi:prepilin-type N-terminal cleavage/methylation domain-containing protein
MARTPRIDDGRSRTPSRGGYTLVELMSVITLAGILLALAGPRIDLPYYRLSGAMDEVSSELLVAQRTAIQTQHDVVVAFDESGSRMRVHQDLNNNHRVDAGERAPWVPLGAGIRFGRGDVEAMAGYSDAVSFTRREDGYPSLVFMRNGSASEEGIVYLTSTRSLESGEYPRDAHAIFLQRSTGRPSVYRYTGAGWERDL